MWKITLDGDRLVFTPFFDEESKKAAVNTLYGQLVMDKVRDKFWSYNEIGKKDDEIQDLKLENDRLKQREEKMLHVIRSIACDYGDCEDCLFFGSDNLPCGDAGDDYKVCVNLLEELEDLG